MVIAALMVTGCGDDDDDATTDNDTPSETDGSDEETVEVTLVDYGFEDLPGEVDAGTTFTLRNDSEAELHEFVAILLPDDEERSVEELLQLSEEELGPLLGSAEPAAVLLAMPGSDETIPAVGTGTLSDPGRYLIACFIPQGADPQEYLDSASESEEGPPEVEGGPPHFTLGMQAELLVR
jgi:hypothetical protein